MYKHQLFTTPNGTLCFHLLCVFPRVFVVNFLDRPFLVSGATVALLFKVFIVVLVIIAFLVLLIGIIGLYVVISIPRIKSKGGKGSHPLTA